MRWLGMLVVVLVLAGCTRPGPPTPAGPDGDAVLGSIAFSDCEEHLGVFPVRNEDAAAALPEGFSPAGLDAAGASAALVLLSIRCEVVGSADTPLGPVGFFVAGLTSRPPEAYVNPDAAFHIVLVAAITDGLDFAARLAAWNVTYATGKTTLEGAALPVGAQGTSEASAADVALAMDTSVTGDTPEAAGLARFFSVEGDVVRGVYDHGWEAGPGSSGTATGAMSGIDFPSPDGPGAGFHYAIDGPKYTFTRVDLPEP